jgi:hypothetical protein
MNYKVIGIVFAFFIFVAVVTLFAFQFKDTLRYLNEDNVKQRDLLISESIYIIFNNRTYYHNEVISMIFEKSELDTIQLFYSIDNGLSWIEIVNNVVSNEYDWEIPNTIFSDKVKLRIKSINGVEFVSGSFTIMPSISFKSLSKYVYYDGEIISLELQSTDDEILSYGGFVVEYSSDSKEWYVIDNISSWVPSYFGVVVVRFRSTKIRIPFEASGILASPITIYHKNEANNAYGNFVSLSIDSDVIVFKNKPIEISWTLWDNSQQNETFYVDYLYSGEEKYTNYQTVSTTNANIYNLTTSMFTVKVRIDDYNYITSSTQLRIVNQWTFLYDTHPYTTIFSSDGVFYIPIFIQTYGAQLDTSQISLQLLDIYTLVLQTFTISSTTVSYDNDIALVLFKLVPFSASWFHVIFNAQNQTYISESAYHYNTDGSIDSGKYVIVYYD